MCGEDNAAWWHPRTRHGKTMEVAAFSVLEIGFRDTHVSGRGRQIGWGWKVVVIGEYSKNERCGNSRGTRKRRPYSVKKWQLADTWMVAAWWWIFLSMVTGLPMAIRIWPIWVQSHRWQLEHWYHLQTQSRHQHRQQHLQHPHAPQHQQPVRWPNPDTPCAKNIQMNQFPLLLPSPNDSGIPHIPVYLHQWIIMKDDVARTIQKQGENDVETKRGRRSG